MKRPVGVTVVAAGFIIMGVGRFLIELWIMRQETYVWDTFLFKGLGAWWGLLVWFTLAIGVCWTAAGIGLWRLRKWARRLAIVLCLLAMVTIIQPFIIGYFNRNYFNLEVWLRNPWPMLQAMALQGSYYGLILFYMFTNEVKRAFSV